MGTDDNTKTLPTDNRISKGNGRTSGWFSSGVRQREQIGVAPFGGCSTTAGPQQQEGQR